ncbi:hypothetical protein crov121 [Cafeteria roenbergensis virus]|uniref:Uncharacterized protein n=1 Tax=Cafeteria roenbergensis virus (strain BV-PW1) TaxID=693272 RepID=E3T4P1_CROVB|nr:hypothetical protein crov121 [Cafeteria roenbergensis virus BV-PW1]ADO67154.1 hypothetical protein crov121 [Cafeteria roenbergensis virus BV-PW1]
MDTLLNIKNVEILQYFIKPNKKEKFNMILEPLQTMFQLALLSYSPIGTKISIHNNIVVTQNNTMYQGVVRWFNNDNKQDLFHLYLACIRFTKFYGKLSTTHKPFYDLLIARASIGIDNLKTTYKESENLALLQTLSMFQNIIKNKSLTENTENTGIMDIDKLLSQIVNIYDNEWFEYMSTTLKLLDKTPSNYINFITSINYFLEIKNTEIRSWLKNNIVL